MNIKQAFLLFCLWFTLIVASAEVDIKVFDEVSLKNAIANANSDSRKNRIVFEENAQISLTSSVIYTGSQDLTLLGNGVTLDGSATGSFVLDGGLMVIPQGGSLIFNTRADITIKQLTLVNSATRGIVINIPHESQGDDIRVSLHQVHVSGSALYGVHIDDNLNDYDEGHKGSAIGIELNISDSSFIANGTGAFDFDGIRVDERGVGDISAYIVNTYIEGNGADGLELDEGGEGSVNAVMKQVTLNQNGFYHEQDFDDGFDIDETGAGHVNVILSDVQANYNMNEGLDFSEQGEGNIEVMLTRVTASDNKDDAIKIDEEDAGNITAKLNNIVAINSDDGVQLKELGSGYIDAELHTITATGNKKYGIRVEQ